jgi:hypothetical protein
LALAGSQASLYLWVTSDALQHNLIVPRSSLYCAKVSDKGKKSLTPVQHGGCNFQRNITKQQKIFSMKGELLSWVR